MAPKSITTDVVQRVRFMWAEDRRQSARAVHRAFKKRFGADVKISERKVQQIIALAKKQAGDRALPSDEWRPWVTRLERPEDSGYLLKVDAVCVADYGRHLLQHEAEWGRHLRVALEGLTPYQQWCFIREYGSRASIAYFF